jgi:hypothetical protein
VNQIASTLAFQLFPETTKFPERKSRLGSKRGGQPLVHRRCDRAVVDSAN